MARHDRTSKFEAAGSALFFIWVSIAWHADVGVGVGLLGVAAIILGMYAARKLFGVNYEDFWDLVGVEFALAGIWKSQKQRGLVNF